MGSAASIEATASLDLEKVKALAGDKWDDALEARLNAAIARNEGGVVTLKHIKFLAPQLFGPECTVTLEEAKELCAVGGKEWSEELTSLFASKATAPPAPEPAPADAAAPAPADAAAEAPPAEGDAAPAPAPAPAAPAATMPLGDWAALVPTLFETAEDKQARLDAEFKALLARRADGNVTVNYQMYNEPFPVAGNTLTAARIDEDYGLTDVMPGCRIRLSAMDSKARTLYANAHPEKAEAPWVREEPEGTFRDLLADETYYCIVIENPAQYAKDMAEIQSKLKDSGAAAEDDCRGARPEGCSCLYGNPCVDQYICKDWDNRMSVAKANGWKGF